MHAPMPKTFEQELVAHRPDIYSLCVKLTRSPVEAEDLVQEAMTRALEHRADFVMGTNMGAWLWVIARNVYFSQRRKRKREVEDVDDVKALLLVAPEDQHTTLLAKQALVDAEQLPEFQLDALIGMAMGHTYEDLAAAAGCPVGTIKSRANRARQRMQRGLL